MNQGIAKAELFDLYPEAFLKLLDIVQNSWLTEAGRFRQMEEIVLDVEKKVKSRRRSKRRRARR